MVTTNADVAALEQAYRAAKVRERTATIQYDAARLACANALAALSSSPAQSREWRRSLTVLGRATAARERAYTRFAAAAQAAYTSYWTWQNALDAAARTMVPVEAAVTVAVA